MRLVLLPVLLLTFVFTAPAFGQQSPTQVIKKTVDEVIRIVSDKELKKPRNEEKRRKELRQAIGAVFDYGEMTQRSMARHWLERTPAEQKELVGLFETLLENSYADKIESYDQQKVVYGNQVVDGNYAEVRSKIIDRRGDEFSLNYRLLKKGDAWRVYDVVIEGVSLVANYRSQFNKIINSEGYPALVKKLKTKSKEIGAT